MSFISPNALLRDMGFPTKIIEEISPYTIAASHPAYSVLTEIVPQTLTWENLKKKGFKIWNEGTTVMVLTHEKLDSYVIKFPFEGVPNRAGIKRVEGHFQANQFIENSHTNGLKISHNWLLPTKCNPKDVKEYESFIKSKAMLKHEEEYGVSKEEAYAIFRNSLLVVEERLDLLSDSEKEKALVECFNPAIIDTMEKFFLQLGEYDMDARNVGATRKGDVALYDIAYWKKNAKVRLQNGIRGFSHMYLFIPENLKKYWAEKTILLLKEKADEGTVSRIFHGERTREVLFHYGKRLHDDLANLMDIEAERMEISDSPPTLHSMTEF